jgi:hypothetical protein
MKKNTPEWLQVLKLMGAILVALFTTGFIYGVYDRRSSEHVAEILANKAYLDKVIFSNNSSLTVVLVYACGNEENAPRYIYDIDSRTVSEQQGRIAFDPKWKSFIPEVPRDVVMTFFGGAGIMTIKESLGLLNMSPAEKGVLAEIYVFSKRVVRIFAAIAGAGSGYYLGYLASAVFEPGCSDRIFIDTAKDPTIWLKIKEAKIYWLDKVIADCLSRYDEGSTPPQVATIRKQYVPVDDNSLAEMNSWAISQLVSRSHTCETGRPAPD